jgi:UDP-N-acetylmuramate: L-alanyl-gamma-D-glutamyl-meso-diaminopimelate ligase
MHIHILGICGTFMGGIAAIASEAGHRVTGCDANVYPPMSTQLEALGIELINGFDVGQLALKPDLFLIGNGISRGNPLLEAILNAGVAYDSAPAWLHQHVLRGKHVLAVAGTHGKTTTTAMLTHILQQSGLKPGYLIGGVAHDFAVSAHLGGGTYFVIEADEYDTALFDKRSKFLHYPALTAVLNNLEYDHADIFPDLAAIERQFHHWLRRLPNQGSVVVNAESDALQRVLAQAVYGQVKYFNAQDAWHWQGEQLMQGSTAHGLLHNPNPLVLAGQHNRSNALAAVVAAQQVGVSPTQSLAALATFQGVRRRLELRGSIDGIDIYDDFAHHPTAIATTLAGLRALKPGQRLIAVLEPRSNTMKQGAQKAALPEALNSADLVYCYAGGVNWDVSAAMSPLNAARQRCFTHSDLPNMIGAIVDIAQAGDQILLMSNGGFGGAHSLLLNALRNRSTRTAPA